MVNIKTGYKSLKLILVLIFTQFKLAQSIEIEIIFFSHNGRWPPENAVHDLDAKATTSPRSPEECHTHADSIRS